MSADIKARIMRARTAGAPAAAAAPAPAATPAAAPEKLKFGLGNFGLRESWEIPESYLFRELLCVYDHLPVSVVVPFNTTVPITVPLILGYVWFCPVAWRVNVRDEADCSLPEDAWILGVTIGQNSMFAFPTVILAPPLDSTTGFPILPATTQFIKASDLDPDDCCACPTADWCCFSTPALGCPLTVFVYNPCPQSVRVTIDIVGMGMGACCDWRMPNGSGNMTTSAMAALAHTA